MASLPTNVLSLFGAPDKNTCEHGISLALLKVRASGLSAKQIGEMLGVSAATVDNAIREDHLLGFEQIARLLYFFNGTEETKPIRDLWECAGPVESTTEQRIDKAIRELELIKKGLGA